MWKWILDHLKLIAIISLITTACLSLGVLFNQIIPWTYLTQFFSLMRWSFGLIDFLVDTPTLIILIGLALMIQVAYWSFRGVMLVVHYFRPRA